MSEMEKSREKDLGKSRTPIKRPSSPSLNESSKRTKVTLNIFLSK